MHLANLLQVILLYSKLGIPQCILATFKTQDGVFRLESVAPSTIPCEIACASHDSGSLSPPGRSEGRTLTSCH